MSNQKHILISPLDWGLGHATRCIPIINCFLDQGAKVSIAAYGKGFDLLKENFPQLNFIFLQGIGVQYQRKGNFAFNLAKQVPSIFKSIKHEQAAIKKIISANHIDAVVSDNRFGLYSKQIPCVFITHQLQIPLPTGLKWLSGFLQILNYRYINKFSECWVPDAAGEINLAGKMAHPKKLPAIPIKYLGAITRMKKVLADEKKWKAIIVLSGPEPQRTLFEEKILDQIKNMSGQFLLVRGLPGKSEFTQVDSNLWSADFLNQNQLAIEIAKSSVLISRSGYTTILDLTTLNIPAILVPTPGQTEQELLAENLMREKICLSYTQSDFKLTDAILEDAKLQRGFASLAFESKLNEVVKEFLASLK